MAHDSLTAADGPPPRPWRAWVWVSGASLVALIAWFYLWTAQSSANPYVFEAESKGYYNLLTDGYRAGHLWMNVEPDPALVAAANPHDPNLKVFRLHDASYYQGRYYLYFGSTPVLVLFLPFKVLTGLHCPENLAVAIFCLAGLLVNAALAALLLRRFFPGLHPGWWLAAIVVLGFGNMAGVLLRRAAFWDVPIASAYAFGSATLLCALLALTGRRVHLWLALAGISLGLAIGSRPVFAFGAAGLLALWWGTCDRRGGVLPRLDRPALARGAALFLPFGLLVAVILWHNYARFENPFEFGMKWALTGYDMLKWKMLDGANLPLNAWYYFLAPAHWSLYFPFVQPIGPAPVANPGNYYGQDNVYGLLPNMPIALFLGAAVLAVLRRRAAQAVVGAFVGLLAVMFATNSLVLLLFSASAGRYLVDMAPYGVLLGVIGVWAGREALARRPLARRVWVAAAGVAAAVTVVFNFFVGFPSGRIYELQNPAGYARAARLFNTLPALAERAADHQPGPLALRVRFPKDRPSHYEPLVTTGWYYLGDILYAKYGADGLIEFGFTHMNSPTIAGAQVRIDYDAEHLLEIEMGSLYPPVAHPWFDRLLPQQAEPMKRRLRVMLNGREVLAADTPFYESSPGDVLIGRNPLGFIVEQQFTGRIAEARRIPVVPRVPADPAAPGPVRFELVFPADKAGQSEPLVTTGVTGAGDVIYVTYEADGRVRFGHDHWGHAAAKSEPVTLEPGRTHVVEVWTGALLPAASRQAPPWGEPRAGAEAGVPWCAVRLDGKIVWAVQRTLHPADPTRAVFLQNPIGSTASTTTFTGQVAGWDRKAVDLK